MIKVGTRVQYLPRYNCVNYSGYVPKKVGVQGTVVESDYDVMVRVKWDEGTYEGAWLCNIEDVEEVTEQ